MRLSRLFVLAVGTVAVAAVGCHAPGTPLASPGATVPAARLAIAAMAEKPNRTWQDAVLAPGLPVATGYRVQAESRATWNVSLPSRSTSAPAYKHRSMHHSGSEPLAGETVYVASDAAAGAPQVFCLDATTGAVINDGGWDALAGLPDAGTFDRTAVMLSADNARLYLLSSGGYFICLDAKSGERLFAQRLSVSGFAGIMPFIDYSNGGGHPFLGSDEHVYAVSADGSVYRVRVYRGSFAVAAWPAIYGSDAQIWPGAEPIPYAMPVNATSSALAWQGRAYFGTAEGEVHRVDVNGGVPVLTTWAPGKMTSAPSVRIEAPVSVDFTPALAVSHIFVAVGDRLAWIDPAAMPVEDAVIVSPPLAVDKTSSHFGRLADYPYTTLAVKGPYDCLDFGSVATFSSPAPTAWGNGSGTNGSLFGASGYRSSIDGNTIRGYMQFDVPPGDFGGAIPVKARIDLSARTAPVNTEVIDLYRASNFQAGNNVPWVGFNYMPDIDYYNRPRLLSETIGTFTGTVNASSATTGLPRYSLPFSDPMPGDAYTTNEGSWHAYAMISRNKQRNDPPIAPESSVAGEWYRGIYGHNVTEPKLYVTVDTAARMPLESGLRSQATLDPFRRKVWVLGTNALFELSYATPGAFQRKQDVHFALTAAGRSAGPSAGGRYVTPRSNVLHTGQRLIVADHVPGTQSFSINTFTASLGASADPLVTSFDAGAGSDQVGESLIFDYFGGSVYATTRDARLVRLAIQ